MEIGKTDLILGGESTFSGKRSTPLGRSVNEASKKEKYAYVAESVEEEMSKAAETENNSDRFFDSL